MIGETIGHYLILRQLGVGGMGEVFLAEDQKLKRQVALKFLPPDVTDADLIERFRREAQAIAALNHPNIVVLYSVEQDGERHYLTMEYIEGRTLGDTIPKQGLPVHQIVDIGVALASALATAHARGIVHRDLKPSNVMMTPGGTPKILDFGLAKWQEPRDDPDPTAATELLTQAGTVMGTAPYMSPEQLQGLELDHRTDIFSLGVMLFEMTTGRRPFTGGSSAELVSSILRDEAPQLSMDRRGLPDQLTHLIWLCLEKNRDHRMQSAADVERELRSLQPGTVTGMPSVAMDRSTPVRSFRRPLAAGAVIAILAAVAVALWLLPREASADRQALAVLPFANLTGDPADDYLGEGMSAGLLTQLGEASAVRVIGRAATWNRSGSPTRVARELGVGSLVDGEVQRDGDRLVVDVRLTDVGTGLVLWSGRFETDRERLMSLQREVAEQLMAVLSVRLSDKELERMARDPTRSFEAYEFFLRGFERLETGEGAADARDAATLFRQALRLDDEFALAHAGLSEALWRQHQAEPGSDLLVRAEEAARAALALDPALPTAQVALARVLRARGRSGDSIERLQEVLVQHPKPAEAYLELAASYEQTGDLANAEESYRSAVLLADSDWFTENALGMFLARHGHYDEARAAFEQAATQAPEAVYQPRENLATLDLSQGRFDEAVAAFERIPKPIRQGRLASNIGTAYYYSSHPEKWQRAEEYYQLAVELSPRRDVYRGNLADLYLERGRADEATRNYRIAWALVDEQLEANPESTALLLRRAQYEAKGGDCASAVRHAAELVLTPPQTAPKAYGLAKVFALCSKRRAALDALALAKRLGGPLDMIEQDREFRSLAGDPEFVEIVGSG